MLSASSPWYDTPIINDTYLDILNIRTIPSSDDDPLYKLTPTYTHRPDLLAYDMYNDYRLWWVFAQRNMDIIRDPIYDFVPGLELYLPQANNLRNFLGLG